MLLIGLGVGVDYALFVMTRRRRRLPAGKGAESPIVEALTTSGRSVPLAGVTVCVALLGKVSPRTVLPVWSHGHPAYCFEVHSEDDPRVGSPLCAECFDYDGADIFNASASALWLRALTASYRAMAGLASLTEKQLRLEVRISYQKVWEFQRRGLVHLHAVVRFDAAEPPPSPPPEAFDAVLLAQAVTAGIDRARLLFPPLPGRSGELLTFGGESGTSVVELSIGPEEAEKIASFHLFRETRSSSGISPPKRR